MISNMLTRWLPSRIDEEKQFGLRKLSDASLRETAQTFRDRVLDGESESNLVGDFFPVVREAARRCLGMEHRDNQLQAARSLLGHRIVELPTGEGKTLAATPALALRALIGRGVWLATANDYLAKRDAETMQGVFDLLGLSVGFVQSYHSPEVRQSAYACDITYGTIREFGFDFLRDRLNARRNSAGQVAETRRQRDRFSIIVDEADSILLDDARTPLIVSEPFAKPDFDAVVRWSVAAGRRLKEDTHYLTDPTSTHIWLTESGRARIRSEMLPDLTNQITLPEAYDCVARSIEAEHAFFIERDYVIRDGKIVIVDRSTGRLAEGRQWQNGIQQSLEAANQLEISAETNPVATITVQSFLRGFEHLSGMTGTAQEAAKEFWKIYKLRTISIPPFVPCRRIELPVQVLNSRREKWESVISAVRHMLSKGRPVLVGTRDLDSSEELSAQLHQADISHQVLTAKQEAIEADLISQAGQRGTVTVSTNIAGRGTDIRLGPEVADAGGLHVIAADLFDASRIDRQLAGRGGRQGDPATYQQILSLEDDLISIALESDDVKRQVSRALKQGTNERFQFLRHAQQKLEQQHVDARRRLLLYDRDRTKRMNELGFDPYLDDLLND
jgi:preprotein translocase subunit SecA